MDSCFIRCYVCLFAHTSVQHDFHTRWCSCHLTVNTNGTGTAYHSGKPEFTLVFDGIRLVQSLLFSFLWIVLWTIVCLFVFLSFGNGIVCFFDLRLWLHLWDRQTFLRSDFIQMCNKWDFYKRNATFICNFVFNIYIVAVVTEAYTPRAGRCKLYVI